MICPKCKMDNTLDMQARICRNCNTRIGVIDPSPRPGITDPLIQRNTQSQQTTGPILFPQNPPSINYTYSRQTANEPTQPVNNPPSLQGNFGPAQLGSGNNYGPVLLGSGGNYPPLRPPQQAKSAPRNFVGTVSLLHTRSGQALGPTTLGVSLNQKSGLNVQAQPREQRTLVTWNFRVTRYDANNNAILPPIQVQMRGHDIDGDLHEGDLVRIPHRWKKGKIIRTRVVYNLTTDAPVRTYWDKALVRRFTGCVSSIIFIIGVYATFQYLRSTPGVCNPISGPGSPIPVPSGSIPVPTNPICNPIQGLIGVPPQLQKFIGPSFTPLNLICLGLIALGILLILHAIFGFRGRR